MPQPDYRKLVLEKDPEAHEYDDGQWVYIRTRKEIASICPYCRQDWKRKEPDQGNPIGAGPSSEQAWKSAAEHLGLI